MMRSMFAGVSGLRVHQTKMDVIANNIANINTVGFKRSSTSFKESFNQMLSAATSATDARGGVNPQQIGMGVNVGSIVTVMGQGAAQRTDYGSDLMIDGDGFFIVEDTSGYSFTRAGVFEIDATGNLVDANGYKVCGWKAVPDEDNPGSQKIVQDKVTGINIYEGDNAFVPSSPTGSIDFAGNLNITTHAEQNNTFSFYDSVGNKYTVDARFTYDDAAVPPVWNFTIPDADPAVPGVIAVTVNGGEKYDMNITIDPLAPQFQFNDGVLDPAANAVFEFDVAFVGDNPFNSGFGADGTFVASNPISVDFSGLTQFNSKPTVASQTKDGNTAGSMEGYSIDGNGQIIGTYSNGQTKLLAQIALANFKNPSGLEKIGNNLYKETGNSSEFDTIGSSADNLGSRMQSGALEMSNVDLAYEFSEMIITQRGFQANSRIITTSDEMIQELVNLKR